MRNFQLKMHRLPGKTYEAGGTFSIPLDDLPTRWNTRKLHLIGISFECNVDATYTAAPTVIGYNNLVKTLQINDGRGQRASFPGGFNDLRFFERLENGGLPYADVTTANASTNDVWFSRYWSVGPRRMHGSPGDFMIPTAALLNGSIDGTWGALTDFSADTTAATGSIYVVAHLAVMDDLIVSPFYERKRLAITNETSIAGPATYAFLALANSTSFDAFAAGDIGDVSLRTSDGELVPSIPAEVLARAYNIEFGNGSIGGLRGEPRNATYDIQERIVNAGTPTALMAQAFDLQPILWAPPGTRLTKLIARTETNLAMTTSGSQTTGTIAYMGRFTQQTPQQVGHIMDEAARELGIGIRKDMVKYDTASKELYKGLAADVMPVKAKAR